MLEDKLPLVTIAIPTYNRADSFLKEALQSAVTQTYKNIEIIVSDNFSTDNTEMIVKNFSDTRIKYVKQSKNIGAFNNYNYCVNTARGSFFHLLGDDDKIDPDFVETCVNAIPKGHEPGVVFTGMRIINENGDVISKFTNQVGGFSDIDFFLGWFGLKIPLYLCSTLFNTKRLQKMGAFKSKTGHYMDTVAFLKLAIKFGRIDIRDVKGSFRRHSSNISGNVKNIKAWCEDSLYVLDVMCDLLPENEAEIKKRGMFWFCRSNYDLASGIRNPMSRILTFLYIYRAFNYCYSPVSYMKGMKRLKARIKNHINRFGFPLRKY